MYLLIDNYDSFVYNLVHYMEQFGKKVMIVRADAVTAEQVEALLEAGELQGIVISPGPKTPKECGNCCEIVQCMAGRIPILGVCLGHQIIGHVFGAKVRKGTKPMHGKVTEITTDGRKIFRGLPRTYKVTHYHSLIVSKEAFPESLQVDAWTREGDIMALSHKSMPVYGVQFHPEALLTEYGHELIGNFLEICDSVKLQ